MKVPVVENDSRKNNAILRNLLTFGTLFKRFLKLFYNNQTYLVNVHAHFINILSHASNVCLTGTCANR